MLSNYVTSGIRTAVPALVGWLLGWLVTWGLDVPASVRAWAVGLLTFALLLAYYLIVRALEERWPQLGWLLGKPARPRYDVDLTPLPPAVLAPPAPAVAKPKTTRPPAKKATPAKKAVTKKPPVKAVTK